MRIAVLGGTGALGSGLARRWAAAGHAVTIGSRDPAKAEAKAGEIGHGVAGSTYEDAVVGAEVVALTVPFGSQIEVLETVRAAVQGKILVDTTVPLVPPKVARVQMPAEGSAAQRAQGFVGDGVKVVSAFQNVGARHLQTGEPIDCDVLVSGDDLDACAVVVGLVKDAGLRGIRAGPLANAVAAEALTSVLISINRAFNIHEAGVRITGFGKD